MVLSQLILLKFFFFKEKQGIKLQNFTFDFNILKLIEIWLIVEKFRIDKVPKLRSVFINIDNNKELANGLTLSEAELDRKVIWCAKTLWRKYFTKNCFNTFHWKKKMSINSSWRSFIFQESKSWEIDIFVTKSQSLGLFFWLCLNPRRSFTEIDGFLKNWRKYFAVE